MTGAAAVVKRISNAKVAAVFRAYPSGVAVKLRALRRLIFAVVTARSGSGSTIRIGQVKARDGRYAMYFHCQTTLVDTFRRLYPHTFRYEGNRAILFDEHDEVPFDELSHCIALALTYRLAKARRS
jgi:hypothetical protein